MYLQYINIKYIFKLIINVNNFIVIFLEFSYRFYMFKIKTNISCSNLSF